MARVVEVQGSGNDFLVNTAQVERVDDCGAHGAIIWMNRKRSPKYKVSRTPYDVLRRMIATPGEFASYRDLTQNADAKAPASGWRPIETAPKDGTIVDLWGPVRKREPGCEWIGEAHGWATDPEWINVYTGKKFPQGVFTHWMPVPAGPEDEQ